MMTITTARALLTPEDAVEIKMIDGGIDIRQGIDVGIVDNEAAAKVVTETVTGSVMVNGDEGVEVAPIATTKGVGKGLETGKEKIEIGTGMKIKATDQVIMIENDEGDMILQVDRISIILFFCSIATIYFACSKLYVPKCV